MAAPQIRQQQDGVLPAGGMSTPKIWMVLTEKLQQPW
jgi:hypothetical protein